MDRSNFLIFTETKTDITSESTVSDYFEKHNFKVFFKHRKKKISTFKSGGIIICVKKKLAKYCKIIDTKCPFVLWCVIDKHVHGLEKDILLGGIYTPPEGSIYSSQYCFTEIEQEFINLNCNNKYYVALSGDLNAHIGKESGIIENEINDNVVTHDLQNIFNSDIDCVAEL